MSWRFLVVAVCVSGLTAPPVALAQTRVPPKGFAPSTDKVDEKPIVPKAYMPPAGMCRIWLNDVPASQQPAPTDCATAIKNRPANGRVVFGDDARKDSAKTGKSEKAKARKP
ncbi:MAG: hypothetical protein MNPFHGCM_02381 [Gemmatimonadaceae bacterium]|nr:hypothetical protein [Gemmatimonadaceae bacterium]